MVICSVQIPTIGFATKSPRLESLVLRTRIFQEVKSKFVISDLFTQNYWNKNSEFTNFLGGMSSGREQGVIT